jgi:hypothetical protein
MYVNEKMIPVETIPELEERKIKEISDWVNSSMMYLIHCKNFCKCHNILPHSTTIKKRIGGEGGQRETEREKEIKGITCVLSAVCFKKFLVLVHFSETTGT